MDYNNDRSDALETAPSLLLDIIPFASGISKAGKAAVKAAGRLRKVTSTESKVIEPVSTLQKYTACKAAGISATIEESWQIRKAKIHGKAQKTGTEGHDWQSMREAVSATKDPDVIRVHMDQTLSKVTEGKVTSRMRPDVSVVRKDGRISTNEVLSKSQRPKQLQTKIEKMQDLLPPEMRGPGKGGRVIRIKK
jgi:hypothetical protein